MNFTLDEERRMLADSLDRYLAAKYPIEERHKITKGEQGLSREQWSKLNELGIGAALFAEEFGGFGGSGEDIAVVFESLGRGLVVEPFLASMVLAGSVLTKASDEGAASEHIDGIVSGETIATLAHDEAGSRYSLNHVETTAKKDGDGWVLDGAKVVVPFGDVADLVIVSARSGGKVDDEDGISLFAIARDTEGLEWRGHPNIDGTHAAELTLKQVRVPAAALIGKEGAGHGLLEHAIGRGVLALCAESLGAMEVAKKATIEYLQTRKQFGKVIGSFQALQHRMADVLLEVEQARSSVINASTSLESPRKERERSLSAAKNTIGRAGTRVAEETIQLHGGIGVTWELPVAHYAKRLVMIDHQVGDEDYHLERFMRFSGLGPKEAA